MVKRGQKRFLRDIKGEWKNGKKHNKEIVSNGNENNA
jgi:hypothetical protein